ncbi:MAG: DNA repair protein RecN [Steroidobacteraceae bacterium]|jgi:DNA repair protein RecN (Recombination protein N)
MLRQLQIRDFAIIESVELDFAPGMTVLTGETGAGKSMLVDALEILAGGRGGADIIRAGAERADISAVVQIGEQGGALRRLLEEHSISEDSELTIRRSIGTDGRSRAWLNGQTVPVQVLRDACELLIDIHGQHEFQSLVRPTTQRQLVDSFGRLESLAIQVRSAHAGWLTLMSQTLKVEAAASDRHARLDLLRHQVQELDALALIAGEFTALNEERSRVLNRAVLTGAVQNALAALYESEEVSAHSLLARAIAALRPIGDAVDPTLTAVPALLEEAAIRIKEGAQSLSRFLDSIDADPQRQEAIERRLAAIEELARKHRIKPEELPALHEKLRTDLSNLDNAATDLVTLRSQVSAALAGYQELARQLSAHRATASRALSKEVTARMQEMGMPGGRFVIELTPLESVEPSPHGTDAVEFRVSTNPGSPPRAVAKIASGGELARLSLAVQVTCSKNAAPCMVFDEVDSGIGGAVAEIVGRQLRTLGAAGEVLCVTHLPQVAAQAHQHLRVTKITEGQTTRIAVTALRGADRIEELARMLGGVEITARARAHALEMLNRAAAVPDPVPTRARRAPARRQPAG